MKRIAILLLLLTAASAGAQDWLDCQHFPGWEHSGTKRQYDAANLYDYKDGGAEGYLVFGFVHMTSIDCKSGGNTLTVDLSEMTDSDSAYGIFAANLDPEKPIAAIGMGSQIQAQSALLAKGKYYVEIVETLSDPAADDSATIRGLAAALEKHIEGTATPPALLSWFVPGTSAPVRMVPESVLGLRELKRGYVANYAQGQAFIVVEESASAATAALQALRAHFPGAAPAQAGDESFGANAQYLGGVCIFRKGRVLAGYANLKTPQEATVLAAALAARIP